jgi:RNA polymerase sigma factor (sigma-70 family)
MTATAHTRVSTSLHTDMSEPVHDPELDELVARYGHRVRYFAYRVEKRYGLSAQCRDDLISSGNWGLFKALRNRRLDAHEHELSAYISKRVEGAVLDEARRVLSRLSNQADRDPVDFESGLPDDAHDLDWEFGRPQPGPEEMADQEGRWRTIERAIDHLCEDHRRLLMAYASGHSIAEIARGDGSSPARLQNTMSKIGRAVRARSPELRRLLRHEL